MKTNSEETGAVEGKSPAGAAEAAAVFRDFKRHASDAEEQGIPGDSAMHFAGQVVDVSSGIALVLNVLHGDALARINGDDAPLFNDGHTGQLMRLAATAAELLAWRANGLILGADELARRVCEQP